MLQDVFFESNSVVFFVVYIFVFVFPQKFFCRHSTPNWASEMQFKKSMWRCTWQQCFMVRSFDTSGTVVVSLHCSVTKCQKVFLSYDLKRTAATVFYWFFFNPCNKSQMSSLRSDAYPEHDKKTKRSTSLQWDFKCLCYFLRSHPVHFCIQY